MNAFLFVAKNDVHIFLQDLRQITLGGIDHFKRSQIEADGATGGPGGLQHCHHQVVIKKQISFDVHVPRTGKER